MRHSSKGKRKMRPKSKIAIRKKWKDTKTQAKSGYFQTGQKSEKHRLTENRGKNGPTASQKWGQVENRDLKNMGKEVKNTGKIGVFSDRAEI